MPNPSHFPHVFFRTFLPLVWKKPKLYCEPLKNLKWLAIQTCFVLSSRLFKAIIVSHLIFRWIFLARNIPGSLDSNLRIQGVV